MISVIAPCLNEPYLKHFLESLKAQTFKDFEVIIIDGGSNSLTLAEIGNNIIPFAERGINLRVIMDRKRNFGYIRNQGAKCAEGDIMLHCNTDNYLPPNLLADLNKIFVEHPNVISVSGRIYPMGTSIIAHLAYQLFDFLRFCFTCFPMPIKKYRPSGNFMAIRSQTFKEIGGHPEVRANEDGLLGQKLDRYIKDRKQVVFSLKLYVGHYVKKFEEMGGLKAVFFYLYTLGNFFPMIKPLLKAVLSNAEQVFEGVKPQRMTVKEMLRGFWEWL